jgi:NADPH:quinone reductase-like Zn-dependent oxidoreductase
MTTTGLQLRSLVKKDGTLELSLTSIQTPEPNAEEVVVRIDASPINPSDQGLLFGGADLSTAKASGTAASSVITATLPPAALKAMAARLDQSMAVGNEAAGVVVQAGVSPAAQALLGKTVAIVGGSMHAVPVREGQGVPGTATGHDGGGRRRLVRQPAHRARHGRHDAPGGTRRSCTPPPRPTSARCSPRSASRTTSRW